MRTRSWTSPSTCSEASCATTHGLSRSQHHSTTSKSRGGVPVDDVRTPVEKSVRPHRSAARPSSCEMSGRWKTGALEGLGTLIFPLLELFDDLALLLVFGRFLGGL